MHTAFSRNMWLADSFVLRAAHLRLLPFPVGHNLFLLCFFCQAFRQQPLRVSMPHLGVVHVFAPVELPCIILLHLVL